MFQVVCHVNIFRTHRSWKVSCFFLWIFNLLKKQCCIHMYSTPMRRASYNACSNTVVPSSVQFVLHMLSNFCGNSIWNMADWPRSSTLWGFQCLGLMICALLFVNMFYMQCTQHWSSRIIHPNCFRVSAGASKKWQVQLAASMSHWKSEKHFIKRPKWPNCCLEPLPNYQANLHHRPNEMNDTVQQGNCPGTPLDRGGMTEIETQPAIGKLQQAQSVRIKIILKKIWVWCHQYSNNDGWRGLLLAGFACLMSVHKKKTTA